MNTIKNITMYELNTFYPTIVHDDYLVDPAIMKHLLPDTDKKRCLVLQM